MIIETVTLYGKNEKGEFKIIVNADEKDSYIELGFYDKEIESKPRPGRPPKKMNEE